jgi:hypothetical protein
MSLQRHPDCKGFEAGELTITYGQGRGAAETLFVYGFIDSTEKFSQEATIPLESESLSEATDPLWPVKLTTLAKPPVVSVFVMDEILGDDLEGLGSLLGKVYFQSEAVWYESTPIRLLNVDLKFQAAQLQ